MEPRRERTLCNVAYSSFLSAGIILLAMAVFGMVPMADTTAAGIGILVFGPLLVLAACAMLLGVVLAAFLWRHPPLMIMSVLTILLLAFELLAGDPGGPEVMAYAVCAAGLSLRWFFLVRRARTVS